MGWGEVDSEADWGGLEGVAGVAEGLEEAARGGSEVGSGARSRRRTRRRRTRGWKGGRGGFGGGGEGGGGGARRSTLCDDQRPVVTRNRLLQSRRRTRTMA